VPAGNATGTIDTVCYALKPDKLSGLISKFTHATNALSYELK